MGNSTEECAWLETLLKKNDYDKSISRVFNIDVQDAVAAGNNYSSVVQRATLDVILSSGRKSQISLIIKKEHNSEEIKRMEKKLSIFKGETKIYTDLFTKYEQLMNEYQDTNDTLWCDIIGYKAYSLIVFEDLKRKNFRLADRTGLLDKNHALLVMNSLGRFHALGHILLQKGLLNKSELRVFFIEERSPVVENMIVGGLKQLCHVMENYWGKSWKEVAERLSLQKTVIVEKLFKLTEKKGDEFLTVSHGDCWTCNMMFKYCPYDDSVPIAVKFLDFQGTNVNTYGFDLAYFLFSSVRAEIRHAHWNELISEYHKTLSATLIFYGITENIPTIEEINKEMKRLEYYSFLIHLIYLSIMTTEVKDAFFIEKLLPDKDGMDAFNPEIFKADNYKKIVEFDLKKWFNQGLF